mmetsp:Transcript_41552/g.58484  ORF Transcript_41552/g.58484 Transcript_41552/m.58484 type:complete len:179 (+) Transcript_41552:103-639(+)
MLVTGLPLLENLDLSLTNVTHSVSLIPKHLHRLKKLDVSACPLNKVMLLSLLDHSNGFPQLEKLVLRFQPLDLHCFQRIAGNCSTGDDTKTRVTTLKPSRLVLLKKLQFPSLRLLDIQHCPLRRRGQVREIWIRMQRRGIQIMSNNHGCRAVASALEEDDEYDTVLFEDVMEALGSPE